MNTVKKLYKNWTVHNLIAHPLSEIIWLISFGKLEKLGNLLHDVTLPEHTHGEGRG
jgi:hypothetical protein